jgi:hypothetical protein
MLRHNTSVAHALYHRKLEIGFQLSGVGGDLRPLATSILSDSI